MRNLFLLVLCFGGLLVSSCGKEEDPFEFPDDPVVADPTFISIVQRDIVTEEDWVITNSAVACNEGQPVQNFARTSINYDSKDITLNLFPVDSACDLSTSIYTPFSQNEVTDRPLDELNFEFTFSQVVLTPSTEVWLEWKYQSLDTRFDVSEYLQDLADTGEVYSGVIELKVENETPEITVNGIDVDVDFEEGSENHFSLDNSSGEDLVKISLNSTNTVDNSQLKFSFLRVWTFGVPDA